MSFLVEDTDKYSSQSNEETENVPPKLTQSSAKKGKKLFKKPSGMTAILSPAKQVQCIVLFVRHIPPVWKRSGALYEAWVENLGFHFRVQSQLNWISIEDLKCMPESELFLFGSQELIEKQARCFYIFPTAFLCFPCLANFACVWYFLVKCKWKPCEEFAEISVTTIKTLWIFMYLNVLWPFVTFREVVKWRQSTSPQETLLPGNCVREQSNIASRRIEISVVERGRSGIVLFFISSQTVL